MQLQLKHLPFCFLVVAAICLVGAFKASAPHAAETEATELAARP